ncbi:hypothetical protein [Bacillus niameyensis]|uniref:hypothetical protein n=1 Tax=Bacillus niameyensis TaxID=1522308 RepID=UPI000781740A|nr:hypothetical protein [Bacillus niameyensis]
MKLFYCLFTVNLRQSILSVRFLLCALSVTILIIFGVWSWIANSSDVIYLLGLGGGVFVIITGILPLFPFATTFASDWSNRASNFWIVRAGIGNYAISKVLASALSGFFVTALGMLIFILIMRIKLPLFTDIPGGGAYIPLLEAEKPILYLVFYITHISLTSALFAVVALWVSAYLPNKFVAVAAPIVLYFISHRFTTGWEIPPYLRAIAIVEQTYDAGSPLRSLLLKLGIVAGLCLLLGLTTVLQIKRRVEHD